MGIGSGNIMFEMKTLDHLFRRLVDQTMRSEESDDQLTRMHHWIIGYLYEHRGQEIFQRDIETEFRVSRSTTSSMVSLMEQKGLLIRESVNRDARLKRLRLTEKAIRLHEEQTDRLRAMEDLAEHCVTPEEKKELLHILDKLRKGINAKLDEKQTQ